MDLYFFLFFFQFIIYRNYFESIFVYILINTSQFSVNIRLSWMHQIKLIFIVYKPRKSKQRTNSKDAAISELFA